MKVFQGRKKKKIDAPSASGSRTAVVDAMLAIHVSEPGVLLTDMPSGDRLISIAGDALRRHGTVQLAADAYVRTMHTGGGRPMAEQETLARKDAPGLMSDLLSERGLLAAEHETDVWSEALNPKVGVVWVAAVRR